VDRLLRGVGGGLLLVGGAHQLRVVAYKRATRAQYSSYGACDRLRATRR